MKKISVWRKWTGYILMVVCYSNCNGKRLDTFNIVNRVVTEENIPLPGVEIRIDNKEYGTTNNKGVVNVSIKRKEGTTVVLSSICPKGYKNLSKQRKVILRHFVRLNGRDMNDYTEYLWKCSCNMQYAAVIIKTNQKSGLPILVHGKEVEKTDEDGIAHILIKQKKESSFQVTIDTSEYKYLTPRSPHRKYQITDQDNIYLFDQKFVKRKRLRKKGKKEKTSRRAIPYRIENQ